ncbi:MAG: cation:proton antiporter [Verrucomicrobia bacterium]|nr:cation:proton antiporter [Verrucomicrobiota bacterium]MCH8511159.1 cation:proton antiporter [Kiritimatiellia bacterium]
MHLITENHLLLFFIQIGVLLACARGLGELFRRWGQPSITAEILVGIFFGPSIFGRMAPDLQMRMFPDDPTQLKMLGTVAWLGILLFLLKAGLETNFATAWRQRNQALTLSFSDLIIPMVIAFIPCYFLPEAYIGEEGNRLVFSLFIAVIMTISALPVTARVLQDLKIYRTDLGLLIMSALTINDVAGWIVFAMILGVVSDAGMTLVQMAFVLGATLVYATLSLTVGSHLFNRVLGIFKSRRVPEPAGSLTLVFVCGIIGGTITTWIGIHALFGFFIAGIMAGESPLLSERARHIFDQMVQALLVPIFFASIGLHLDFLGNFDLPLISFIFVIGFAGRYIGAYVGGRLIRQSSLHSRLIADAHVPGGEMQIIIGMLALEYGVISERVYVAIIFGAIATSVIAGPLMGRLLRKIERVDWLAFLPVDQIIPQVKATQREGVIQELCAAAENILVNLDPKTVSDAVQERERQMSTALEDGIAVPHARLENLDRPVVVFGHCPGGVDWNSSDGKPARLVFVILTPTDDPNIQLQILQGITKTLGTPGVPAELMKAKRASDMLEILRKGQVQSVSSKKSA